MTFGMKRILLTVHKFFPEHRAGTEVLTLKVARELMARGYEVLVVTANPPDLDARHAVGNETEDYVFQDVPVHVIGEPLRLRGYTFHHEYFHPGVKTHFGEVMERFKPDILHIFHAQNLSSSIIDEACERGVPVVCSTTDFWFVCPIVQLKRPDGSVCRGPGPGGRNCLTCYTPNLFPPQSQFDEALAKRYPGLASALSAAKPLSRFLFETYKTKKRPQAEDATLKRPGVLRDAANRTRAIMVPTKLMRDIFVENGIRADLIEHVPFGIDTAPLIPYQKKVPSNVLRIGFIGTLFEHKGTDLLIKAFHQLPADAPAVLKIYGDPNQFPEYGSLLKKLAAEGRHREQIEFLGTFPNEQLGEVLANLDILVVPSRWYENTPLVIQSSLATRTPLLVTDLGGMSEIVKHGENGLLFTLNDVESLKVQLQSLLDDPSLAKRLSDNIPPERTTAEMVDDIEKVYRERCTEKPMGASCDQAQAQARV
ncbi:MAG: glycosyltransferase family 4 protein [Candidatus Obscuribacterales bacterium]